jgi:predicted nucleic acid-binding protein
MRVVVDSNILVSAMLSPHGPPAQVVRLVLQAGMHDVLVLSPRDLLDLLRREGKGEGER